MCGCDDDAMWSRWDEEIEKPSVKSDQSECEEQERVKRHRVKERTIDSLVPFSVYFLRCLAFSVHVVSWIARAVCQSCVCVSLLFGLFTTFACDCVRRCLLELFAFVVCGRLRCDYVVEHMLLGIIFALVDMLSTRVV